MVSVGICSASCTVPDAPRPRMRSMMKSSDDSDQSEGAFVVADPPPDDEDEVDADEADDVGRRISSATPNRCT